MTNKPILACATIRVEKINERLCATVARFDVDQLPVGSLTNVYAALKPTAERRPVDLEAAAREMLRIAGIAKQGSNAYNRAIINLHNALNPDVECGHGYSNSTGCPVCQGVKL